MYSFFPKKYLLADRYLIEKQLGQGGFGITYKAYDEKLKKTVCIKELFISGNSTRSENYSVQSQSVGELDFSYFKKKFLEEAQKLASFNHPSIVRVLDFFEANNTAYMVMDFVEGETLKQSIETTGALAEEEAMNYILQLLDAVDLVHRQNILHRDIKPENILITKDKRVVLIDFGTAKFQATDNETTHIKNSTIAVLSPKYAPPEQYNTESKKGTFTDVYALGATLYFLLTNQEPPDVNGRAIDGIKNPKDIVPSISKHVDAAVMKAMNLKPKERFQNVSEFREALNSEVVIKPEFKAKDNKMQKLSFLILLLVVGVIIVLNLSKPTQYIADGEIIEEDIVEEEVESEYPNAIMDSLIIGSQVWSKYNIDVTHFRNGDAIPHAKTVEEWLKAGENKQPAWCYYDNDPANGKKYGKLYNWYAVNDPRGIAPEGWNVPTENDWQTLIKHLEKTGKPARQLKNSYGWETTQNLPDESIFYGLPNGFRNYDATYYRMGELAYWWTATSKETLKAQSIGVSNKDDVLYKDVLSKKDGLALRVVKPNLNYKEPDATAKLEDNSEKTTDLKTNGPTPTKTKAQTEKNEVKKEDGKTQSITGTVTDIDGNTYKTVKIGDQVWMAENLNVSRFRNGDLIHHTKTREEFMKAGAIEQPAWCYFDYDPANGAKYGKLYNWYAVNDPRGLAPKGWHIPSDPEWKKIIEFLGGREVAGKKMKSRSGWNNDGNGTDESGFSGLPGGFHDFVVPSINDGAFGYWWSSTEKDESYVWNHRLTSPFNDVDRIFFFKGEVASVRCLKD